MSDERDAIRQRVDIVDLVSQRVRLKRSGKNFTGLCPFHDDKNASFFVSPNTGRYRCFSCGESGDAFTWVMKTQGLEFRDALKQLAVSAGITLQSYSGPTAEQRSERDQFLSIMELAQIFFRNELLKSDEAQAYLNRRKIPSDVAESWGVGFAPSMGEALVAHLKRQNVSLIAAKQLFLTDQDSSGGFFDKFRGRLMFPIRDDRGALVGYGGRIIGDGNPKYINSSDTPLYHKSRVLYGLHVAKDKMMKERRAVLVEGYLDVIACHRAGVTEAVASCGTALTSDQVKLLKRFADRVTICYDADAAGQKAALKALDLFAEEGLPCRVAMMPAGEDPDTLLNSKGAKAVRDAVEQGQSPFDFRIWHLEKQLGLESEEFWEQIPKLLATAESELDLEKHLLRLAGLHPAIRNPVAAESALRREVKSIRRPTPKRSGRDANRNQPIHKGIVSRLSASEVVFFRALFDPELRFYYWSYLEQTGLFMTASASRLREAFWTEFGAQAPIGSASQWISRLDQPEILELLDELSLDVRVAELSRNYVDDTIRQMMVALESHSLQKQRPQSAGVNDENLNDYLLKLRKLKGIEPER